MWKGGGGGGLRSNWGISVDKAKQTHVYVKVKRGSKAEGSHHSHLSET